MRDHKRIEWNGLYWHEYHKENIVINLLDITEQVGLEVKAENTKFTFREIIE
jgi:hypothetical protein